MKKTLPLLLALCADPALAAGDAATGEKTFKKCQACHAIIKDDGTAIVKGGKVGPNLFGLIGRAAGSTDFAYGDSIKALGATGLVWDAALLGEYLADPTVFLQQKLSDPSAKSKMTFKLNKGAEDIAAYLSSLAP